MQLLCFPLTSHKSGSLVYLCAGILFLFCVKYVIIITQLLSNIYLACITIANVMSLIAYIDVTNVMRSLHIAMIKLLTAKGNLKNTSPNDHQIRLLLYEFSNSLPGV